MKFIKANALTVAGLIAIIVTIVGCAGDETSTGESTIKKIEANSENSGTSSLISVDGNLFSISSPLESIVLLKKSAMKFNSDVMMEIPDMAKLTSNFDKAIHLGMIGADMGYASIHDQQMKSIDQFKTLSSLSNDLNLGNAVDEGMIKRLANNTNNVDSMLLLVSEFYREADQYLQTNDRMDVASWIIAGGWIESMHFSMDVIRDGNEDLKQRIAGQKNSYKNLLKMVRKFSNNDQSKKLVNDLVKLEEIFDEVIYTYNYKQPTVDVDKKQTILRGSTNYKFTDETLLKLNTSISELRESLITQ